MTSAPQFYASRLLTGLFESGMYPALAITLTTFYTPQEQARRFAYLYLSVGLSGGLGGLFAYALLKLDGTHGIAGWCVSPLHRVKSRLTYSQAMALHRGRCSKYRRCIRLVAWHARQLRERQVPDRRGQGNLSPAGHQT
jgi:MFS family permease